MVAKRIALGYPPELGVFGVRFIVQETKLLLLRGLRERLHLEYLCNAQREESPLSTSPYKAVPT